MRERSQRAAPRRRGSRLRPFLAGPALWWVVLSLGSLAGCSRVSRPAEARVRAIDLLHESSRASKRPDPSIFSLGEHTVGGETQRTLAAAAPCRIIWTLWLPPRSVVRTAVAALPRGQAPATIAFRVGISDERTYDGLEERRVTVHADRPARWTPLEIDLSSYAGRQWSIFYRPDSHPWRLVFNADLIEGQALAVWGAPGVDTDVAGGREWRARAGKRAQP